MAGVIVGYRSERGLYGGEGETRDPVEWIYIHNTVRVGKPLGAKCFRARSKRRGVRSNAGNSLLPRRTFVS